MIIDLLTSNEFSTEQEAVVIDGRLTLKRPGSGVFVSEIIDAGQALVWEQIHWDADISGSGQVLIMTRFASIVEELENANWSIPYEAGGDEVKIGIGDGVCAARYFQVRIEMSSDNGAVPLVKSISLTSRIPQPSGYWPMDKSLIHPDELQFRWLPVINARHYQVHTAHDPDFTVCARVFDDILDHRFTPPSEVVPESGMLYWRVRAVDDDGKWSSFSTLREVGFSNRRIGEEYTYGPHPRLFLNAARLETLREKAQSDPTVAEVCRRIREKADADIELVVPTPEEADEYEGLHLKFFDFWLSLRGEALEGLAFTYLISGEEKYAQAARRIMLEMVRYDKWTSLHFRVPSQFNPEWIATLETAAMTKGVGIAYDWLYDWLSEEDRKTIREGLVRIGIKPLVHDWCDPDTFWRVPRHQMPGGNWWGVCNGCAGIGALAVLEEEPEAHRWLRLAEEAVRWHVNYRGGDVVNNDTRAGSGYEHIHLTQPNYGVDFGYPESIGYIMYGLTNDLYLVEALKEATGTDISDSFNPNILDEPLYGMYHDAERGWGSLAFNDSGDGPVQSDGSVLFAKHTDNAYVEWIFRQCQGKPDTIHSLLAHNPSVPAKSPEDLPRIKLFRDIGWVIFRTGWGHTDSMMAAKFHQGRGHADLGQFVVHHRGRRQVMESGTVDYHSPIYQTFLAHTKAHNVLMIDDRDQSRLDGCVKSFLAGDGVGIGAADLTNAYGDMIDSWTRGLGFFDDGIYIVWDCVRADGPHKYAWLLHPESGFRADGTTVKMGKDDAGLVCHLLSEADLQVETLPGYLSFAHQPEEHPYLSYTTGPRNCIDFIAIFADEAYKSVTRLCPTAAELKSLNKRCLVTLGDISGTGIVRCFQGSLFAAISGSSEDLPSKFIANDFKQIQMPGLTLSSDVPVSAVGVRSGSTIKIRTAADLKIEAEPGLKVHILK